MCSKSNLAQYNKNIQNNNDNILSQRQYFNSNNMYEEEKTNIKTKHCKIYYQWKNLKKMVYDSSIIISYKNTVLKDDFFVADYHIEDNSTLLIFIRE